MALTSKEAPARWRALGFSKARSAAGTGAIATLVLVLVFGNPIFVDWVNRNASGSTAGGLLLRALTWPHWHLSAVSTPGGVRDVVADDLRAILLVVLVGVLIAAATTTHRVGGLLACWGCVMLAAAVAGLLTAFLTSDASLRGALTAAAGGAAYGVFFGWAPALPAIGRRT